MPKVTCDSNGFVRGFAHHDGSLDGVLTTSDGGKLDAHLALRPLSGPPLVLTLKSESTAQGKIAGL